MKTTHFYVRVYTVFQRQIIRKKYPIVILRAKNHWNIKHLANVRRFVERADIVAAVRPTTNATTSFSQHISWIQIRPTAFHRQ